MMEPAARQRIEREELLRAFEEFQLKAEQSGLVPHASKLPLRRYRRLLEVIGGMALGIITSALAVLFNFIVFNWLLHLGS